MGWSDEPGPSDGSRTRGGLRGPAGAFLPRAEACSALRPPGRAARQRHRPPNCRTVTIRGVCTFPSASARARPTPGLVTSASCPGRSQTRRCLSNPHPICRSDDERAKPGLPRPEKSRVLLKITPEVKRAFAFQSDSTATVSYSQNVPEKQDMRVSCHHLVTEGDSEATLLEAELE